VTYPINPYTGEFNGGNYPEVFLADGQAGVPKNTQRALLHPQDLYSMAPPDAPGDQEDASLYEDEDQTQQPAPSRMQMADAYQPGAESPSEMQQRQPPQIDRFLYNPYSGNR
jgi:hypothetical protein